MTRSWLSSLWRHKELFIIDYETEIMGFTHNAWFTVNTSSSVKETIHTHTVCSMLSYKERHDAKMEIMGLGFFFFYGNTFEVDICVLSRFIQFSCLFFLLAQLVSLTGLHQLQIHNKNRLKLCYKSSQLAWFVIHYLITMCGTNKIQSSKLLAEYFLGKKLCFVCSKDRQMPSLRG